MGIFKKRKGSTHTAVMLMRAPVQENLGSMPAAAVENPAPGALPQHACPTAKPARLPPCTAQA